MIGFVVDQKYLKIIGNFAKKKSIIWNLFDHKFEKKNWKILDIFFIFPTFEGWIFVEPPHNNFLFEISRKKVKYSKSEQHK